MLYSEYSVLLFFHTIILYFRLKTELAELNNKQKNENVC